MENKRKRRAKGMKDLEMKEIKAMKQRRKCAKLAYKISQLPERKEAYED